MPDELPIEVEVVLAWPRRHDTRRVSLKVGASVDEAVAAAGFGAEELACVSGLAVHGERVDGATPVEDGDRVELLRPLQADPKEARRMRAERQRERS